MLALVGAAGSLMALIVALSAVGFACAYLPKGEPLLAPAALQSLSRLCFHVFLPATTFASLGANVSVALLRAYWILPLGALAQTGLSFLFADITAPLSGAAPELRRVLRVAIAQPNAFAYPLLVLTSLCRNPRVRAEFDDDAAACADQAVGALFVYLIGWSLVYWSYSYPALAAPAAPASAADVEVELKDEPDAAPLEAGSGAFDDDDDDAAAATMTAPASACRAARLLKRGVARTLGEPNMQATIAGVLYGLCSPARRATFGDRTTPLTWLGIASRTLGLPVVSVVAMVGAAALGNGRIRAAASAAEADGKKPPPALTPRTACWFLGVRLVLLPCVGFGAAFLLRRLRLWPTRHKLVQLVLLLQLAVPSAQTVLVSLNQLRQIEMGEVLATYYFPMYLASVLTVGFFAALALDFVYF